MRKFAVALAALFTIVVVSQAHAAPPSSIFAGELACTTQPAPDGRTLCSGPGGSPDAAPGSNNAVANTVPSFDGVPIDVNVAFPDPAVHGEGPYPLAMYFHGFGGGKEGFNGDLKRFTDAGMAAFSMTERGFKFSCGKPNAITTLNNDDPGICNKGFIRLMDTRYEVRDAQYFAGLLADEGLILPKKIGTVGASYGGAKSMSLAALKNRIMLPDGTLAPWKSPDGKEMEIAVAAPIVPPTDFAYSLTPNGRTYDYTVDNPYLGPDGKAPYGVMKAAITNGLATAGDSFSGENGTDLDPLWDINGWKNMMNAGEPFGGPVADTMVSEMTTHHSSYYIDSSTPPAPLVIAEGLTDDLFPIGEALRYYNRTKDQYPDATIGLLFADIGHPRAPLEAPNDQGRPVDMEFGYDTVQQWFEYYLKGEGTKPDAGVSVKSMVCPYSQPSGGPYRSETWAGFAPGELQLSDPTRRVLARDGGDDNIAAGFMTLIPGCTEQPATAEPGIAQYDFPVATGDGYTLGGSPTVIADISVENGSESQVAARLLEVAPNGQQRMITRGIYRPEKSGRQVFQLHGNVYRFAPGTRARLQLLPKDGVSGAGAIFSSFRPSNDQRDVTVRNVEVRIPVRENPGALNGLVRKPLPKVLPQGYELAGDYRSIGAVAPAGAPKAARKATVRGKALRLRLTCGKVNLCRNVSVQIRGKRKPLRNVVIARGSGVRPAAGRTVTVNLKLTSKARKAFRNKRQRVRLKGRQARRAKKKFRVRVVRGLKRTGARVTLRGAGPARTTHLAITRNGRVR